MKIKNGASPLQKAVCISVLNIVLNLLLALCKLLAGVFAQSGVLVSDAVHSAADTLCTVLVLSGIGYAAGHPGNKTRKVQAGIVLLLAAVIAGTGIRMTGSAVAVACGLQSTQRPGAAAVAVSAACVAVKAVMFLLTRHFAKQTDNAMLLADAFHHRSDCLSSLLVLLNVISACCCLPVLEVPSRLVLGGVLLFSAVQLCVKTKKDILQ